MPTGIGVSPAVPFYQNGGGAILRIPSVAAFLGTNPKLVLLETYNNLIPGSKTAATGFAASLHL